MPPTAEDILAVHPAAPAPTGTINGRPRVNPLAEAVRRARALPRGHLVDLCSEQKREAERATADLRHNWQRWWDLWQNEVVYQDKEEWQSQVWIPKPFVAVEQAAALIRRSLLDSPDFWGIQGTGDDDKLRAAKVWKPLLKLLLDRTDFAPLYATGTKVGFIMGVCGYFKLRWQVTQTPQLSGVSVDPDTGFILPEFAPRTQSTLALDYVLPWRIRRDPDTAPGKNFSGTYLWHSEFKDRAALRSMERAWDAQALARVLDTGRVGAQPDSGDLQESEQRDALRKQYAYERHRFRHSYLVDEGWLDIIDEHGDGVLPNGFLVHSHGEILYGPAPSPIWATDLDTGRRKWPFVAAPAIDHPARFEGRGILEQDADLSLLYANTLNLFVDAMNWKVNPGTEIYQQGLIDYDDTSDYPGKLWWKNVKEQVLTTARRGEIDVASVMAFLNFVDTQRQEANFVNNFVTGLPGYRSNITKGEVQLRAGQSMSVFESMARNLEMGGRECVALAYDLTMQHMGGNDFTMPSVVSVLGPEKALLLAQMPLSERIQTLQGNYAFTFTGVSQALQKADLLAKTMQFATLAASGPYAGRVDYGQIMRVIAQLLGVDDRIEVLDQPPMPPALPGVAGPLAGEAPQTIPNGPAMMRAVGSGGDTEAIDLG